MQWEPVQYFNNKIICDLVEEKFKGIISILVRRCHQGVQNCWINQKNRLILREPLIKKRGCVGLMFFYLRMRSVCDQGTPVTSPSWRSWRTLLEDTRTLSRQFSPRLCQQAPKRPSQPVYSEAVINQLLLRLCFPSSHKLADAKTRKIMAREEFRLLHYAGEVNYNVNGVCILLQIWADVLWYLLL